MSSRQRAIIKRIVVVAVAASAVFLAVDGLRNENWFVVGFAVFAAVMLLDWLRPSSDTPEPVDPSAVPTGDVLAVISATDDRIPAIKLLRERHPGLGLKDAKDLVDAQLGA